MPPVIDLSQEVLDEIVGHLHDDEATLKTLSVVSSKFLPISRALMFYSLRLDINNCSRWAGYLRDCPSLGSDIKEVELHVAGFQGADERNLVGVLDSVTGPTKFTLTKPPRHPAVLWADIPTWLQQVISRIISQPTVHTVFVREFMNLPLSLLTSVQHWHKLLLSSCSFALPTVLASRPEERSAPGPRRQWKSSLRTLVIGDSHRLYFRGQNPLYEFMDHPEFPLDVANMFRLHIELLPENVDKVENMLARCAHSLRHLGFTFRGATTSIRHLSALKILRPKLDITPHSMNARFMESILYGFLSTLESLYVPRNDDSDRNQDTEGQRQLRLHQPEEIDIPATIFPVSFQVVPQEFWTDLDSLFIKLSPIKEFSMSASTPNSNVLAQEILDEIVRHLHGDSETIKTLSIVSSSFLPICRDFLFRFLRLTAKNCARWDGYLTACPSIAQSVQEVELEVSGLIHADEQQVTFILNRLIGPSSRISTFRLLSYDLLDWPRQVPSWLQAVLSRTMSAPSVTNIDISMFNNLPISFLSGIPYLRKLFLQFRYTRHPNNSDFGFGSSTILSTGMYGSDQCALEQWIGHLDFPLDLTRLSTLHIDLEPRNQHKVQDLLSICDQTLLSLSLSIGGGSTSLRHLSTLRVLQFRICITQGFSADPGSIISGFLRTLKSLETNAHPPKEIVILTFIETSVFAEVPTTLWTNLDSQLSTLSPTTMVRIVTTCIPCYSEQAPDWKFLLPHLHESGRLISQVEGSDSDSTMIL
ncbi:hypothetical protein BDN72DRAFT_965272 [Pluteus cervinus]|uniref:Uncharacterized protein n=1 Tax=Pluteus cervinus TaxID=181527 RepID=A0ACD3A6B9_9AGAR|nr:hypothetical protein BDN72DRAFT_965272 [Pluteus cervinus]